LNFKCSKIFLIRPIWGKGSSNLATVRASRHIMKTFPCHWGPQANSSGRIREWSRLCGGKHMAAVPKWSG